MLVSSIKNYIAVSCRLKSLHNIRQSHSPIKLKLLEASGWGRSWYWCFCFFCVVLVVCNCMMYRRPSKLGTHKQSPSYVTTLYGTQDRLSHDSTEKMMTCPMYHEKQLHRQRIKYLKNYIRNGFMPHIMEYKFITYLCP